MTNFSVDRFHSNTVDPTQYEIDPYIESDTNNQYEFGFFTYRS